MSERLVALIPTSEFTFALVLLTFFAFIVQYVFRRQALRKARDLRSYVWFNSSLGTSVRAKPAKAKSVKADVKRSAPVHASAKKDWSNINIQDAVQVLVTIALLIAALYIVLSQKFEAADKHWAFGTLGTIVGFWLKPSKKS